jgi:hypothetical protein
MCAKCVCICRVENFEGKYSLTIADSVLDDAACYSMKYEEASTSATLSVREKPCEITTPLADTATMEEETIVLVLEISKPRKVTWLCKGEEVTAGERFKVDVDDSGLRITLTVHNVTLDQHGELSVQIDDLGYGQLTSSCQVTVKGEEQGATKRGRGCGNLNWGRTGARGKKRE